jgi:hypothetical protein
MFENFSSSAKDLAKNPLGIIALFIVLVYGFACLLFGFSAEKLISQERMPIIYFVILFPIAILILFGWLVSKHHDKLYAPSDFKDDKSFLATINQDKIKNINNNEFIIEDLINYGRDFEIVTENEENIKKSLIERNLTTNFEDPTIKVLIRQLAVSQVLTWFEKTYNIIFGSQIRILLRGQNSANFVIDKDYILGTFEATKEIHKDIYKDWQINDYLKFLLGSNLLEKKDENFILTTRGKEFLRMMKNSNYSEHKSL